MTTPNLIEFANLVLKLTWSEMEELGASDAFASSYSRTKPAQIVEWAKKVTGEIKVSTDIERKAA